jgi:predicted DNA-binding transcriptional regulator YafY
MRLIYLMDIFLERTDDEHVMTIPELITALSEYDVSVERKTIYSDIELLRLYGMDIEVRKSKTSGYYLASHKFELPELKLLVDAVQSSRFITHKKSSELIKKLSSLTSVHQSRLLRRQVVTPSSPKAINESVYYNIDAIHAAINSGCKISFKYFDYNLNKTRVYRRNGEPYVQTPLALCWSDDKYYLICYSSKYESFVHYRVDRMSSASICGEKADVIDRKRFNVSEHIKSVFGMYGGEVVRATLRFEKGLINSVLDRFGTDVRLRECGDMFEIVVEVSESIVFLSWIIQFGDRAEIISPESLRESMRELIVKLGAIYV